MKLFEDVYETLPANGWLTEIEARLLWEVARDAQGPILEVGCYYGRSTVLLASLNRPIYCVDPFSGFDSGDLSGEKVRTAFVENMNSRDIRLVFHLSDSRLIPMPPYVMLCEQRIEDWHIRPVGFAYLDGDHTYEGTLTQINVALAAGASTVAIHDITNAAIFDAALKLLGLPDENIERLGVWRISYARTNRR